MGRNLDYYQRKLLCCILEKENGGEFLKLALNKVVFLRVDTEWKFYD